MVRAAQEAVMQRPNFAIDAIGDSDDEEAGEVGDGDDEGVMDEVSGGFLLFKPPKPPFSIALFWHAIYQTD